MFGWPPYHKPKGHNILIHRKRSRNYLGICTSEDSADFSYTGNHARRGTTARRRTEIGAAAGLDVYPRFGPGSSDV